MVDFRIRAGALAWGLAAVAWGIIAAGGATWAWPIFGVAVVFLAAHAFVILGRALGWGEDEGEIWWGWTCEACGDRRPDERIDVKIVGREYGNGARFEATARHCSDRPACALRARQIAKERLLAMVGDAGLG